MVKQKARSGGKTNILSNEFIVASEIYHREKNGERTLFGKLVEIFGGSPSEKTIAKSLNILSDWDIVKAEYGATDNDKAARLFKITNESSSAVKKIYETYWEPIRNDHVKE